MGFKEIHIMDLLEIIRRFQAGHSIKAIARSLGHDRSTIRNYRKCLVAKGIAVDPGSPGVDVSDKRVLSILQEVLAENKRGSDKLDLLEPYRDELIDLVTNKGLLRKSAFNVLCEFHPNIKEAISYTSFKRFTARHKLALNSQVVTCRFEAKPGSQLQIDYGKVGRLFDHLTGTLRTLYAFIATLAFSRHKYVELTFSQNQQSFTSSHVKAFNFFGGVAQTVTLDNLKAGVISPSLYEPKFNRTYSEMAKHYGCFLDPARVGRPKDKAIVEADVKTIRAKVKELLVLHPTALLSELNDRSLLWLKEEYGMRRHGTTGEKPYRIFLEVEQPSLIALPAEPFEIAFWKEATVHPDCYIQVQKRSYSVHHSHVGKKVWVKVTPKTVEVYFNEHLIKVHVISRTGNRQTDIGDFPENLQAVLDRGLPRHLQSEAANIGPEFASLIRRVLTPHAYMNLRRAQGLLQIARKFNPCLVRRAATDISPASVFSPKHFKVLLEKMLDMEQQEKSSQVLPMSDETRSFQRSIDYFNH